jgi:hypothetical protein
VHKKKYAKRDDQEVDDIVDENPIVERRGTVLLCVGQSLVMLPVQSDK